MRITVMGTGGVGGYFGARLAQAGCEVGFVARGPQLQALRTQGLRVESPLGDIHLPAPHASDQPVDLGPADVVMLGVKLWDTEGALAQLRPVVGPDTAVISFQNGVVKDELVRAALGDAATVGGVCYIAATLAAPGLIRHTGTMHKLAFGELDGRASPRLQRFAQACAAAGFSHELSTDIRRREWEKFVFLVGLSATTAAMRVPIGRVRENVQAHAFLRDLMTEVAAVARAEGVALAEDFVDERLAFADTMPPSMRASMAHDLERGNRLELPWLSGDVVARGLRLGVPTPCNRAVRDVLAVHVMGAPTA